SRSSGSERDASLRSGRTSVLGQAAVCITDQMADLAAWDGSSCDPITRKTTLTCTMGPSDWDIETLVKMINQGLNIARFHLMTLQV
ncbi:hypothetical protein Pmar_PMAR028573, partial [Perkinsus marinus ATCC 50983]